MSNKYHLNIKSPISVVDEETVDETLDEALDTDDDRNGNESMNVEEHEDDNPLKNSKGMHRQYDGSL